MTVGEAKLAGLLTRAAWKHPKACACEPCKYVAWVWSNLQWVEDLQIIRRGNA